MTPPTDLQAKAPKELREEIERLASLLKVTILPRVSSPEGGVELKFLNSNAKELLRELAAFCYRDAERIARTHCACGLPTHQHDGDAIARRAKEVS